jgi:hypothetical protein
MAYDWTKNPIVPRGDLYAWHQYDPATAADGVANDYAGANRHLTTGTNKSVLTLDVLNGQPGWYFDGTRNPMLFDGDVTFKHVFIVARADEATFGSFRGLLSDKTATTLLVGDNGTDEFFDLSAEETFDYRKSDVLFPSSGQKAPMSGAAAVIELQIPTGVTMNAIQIGDQRNLGRRWKGYFFDQLIYSQIQNELNRQRIYEYFAMRYQIWSEDINGFKIYPFASNKTRSLEQEIENYQSTPYNGDPKALVRGSVEGDYELIFALREQAEYKAAQAFFEEHRPVKKFVFRDYRFYPYESVGVRFTSPIREQGSDVTYRFNYGFSVHTTDVSVVSGGGDGGGGGGGDTDDLMLVDDDGEFLVDSDGELLIDA